MEETDKQSVKQLIPYQWKKGQSGNPNGRPKGKTLKEFAREYLMSLPDEEKIDYLASLPTEIVWKMAEGNPKQESDIAVKELPIIRLAPEIASKYGINSSPEPDSEINTQV